MRRFAFFCCAAVLVACAKSENESATDTAAAAGAMSEGPAPISLGDVAGKWNVRGMRETGDSTLVTYDLNATAENSGWTISFPNRAPVPVRVVAVAGDSIITEAGPYESVLRKGVNVTTRGVMRIQNGRLVGTTVARYSTTGPDSVLRVRTEGTRAP